jgi:hypothetical protein
MRRSRRKARRIWKRGSFLYFVLLLVVVIIIAPVVSVVGIRLCGNPFLRLFAIDVGFERDRLVPWTSIAGISRIRQQLVGR